MITSAQQTLSVDDYGDALAGALRRLELCVRCVRDLRAVKNCEVHLQVDVEPFNKGLSDARSEISRLRALLDQKAFAIPGDLSAKLLSSMVATEPVCDNCGDPATCTGYHEFAGYVHACAGCAETQGRDKELTQIRPLPKTGGTPAA